MIKIYQLNITKKLVQILRTIIIINKLIYRYKIQRVKKTFKMILSKMIKKKTSKINYKTIKILKKILIYLKFHKNQ